MGMMKKKNPVIWFMVLYTLTCSMGKGQESSTMYFMKGVPQSYQLNPAIQPGCRFFLGLPALSPLNVYFENSAFSMKDIIFPSGDSLITILHPNADKNELLGSLTPVNTLQVYTSTDIFSVGYRRENLYYTFDLSEKVYTRLSMNDDLFDLLLTGNKRGDHFNFSNTNADVTSYLELALGNSRIVNDRLKIGTRLKLLLGQINVTTDIKDLSLKTDEDWTIRSKFNIHMSVPGIHVPVDEDGEVAFDSIGFDSEFDPLDLVESAFGNIGLGLDLGMQYILTDKLILSGSIIDLAAIRWDANTYNIRQDASFVYSGIEIHPGDTAGATSNFIDSLSSAFRFTADRDPYYTMLPVKLYVGGMYQVIDLIGFGILSRTEYYKRHLREQLTLSANFSPIKILTFSFSYTLFNDTYNNFGFGFSSRLGPFNLYFISDNIPTGYALEQSSGMILPYDNKILNIRLGLNLVFGCRQVKKKLNDLPLVY
jgi:hypothetical protein